MSCSRRTVRAVQFAHAGLRMLVLKTHCCGGNCFPFCYVVLTLSILLLRAHAAQFTRAVSTNSQSQNHCVQCYEEKRRWVSTEPREACRPHRPHLTTSQEYDLLQGV
jgi:hypothetical protein